MELRNRNSSMFIVKSSKISNCFFFRKLNVISFTKTITMNPILKNILITVCGAFVGARVNMAIVMLGGSVVPPPPGVDLTTMEGLAAGMPLMSPMHFLFPLLAHAAGTFVAAGIIARFAASRHLQLAMIVSALFFVGGLQMVMELPSPMWFNATDLVLAYFPMGWLGFKLGKK
jgi:hypothetical protein